MGKRSVKAEDWSTPKNWPATKIEMRPLSWIREYPGNPRTHPPAQIELLASSMREDGVTAPILVDEGGVILAGHGRRLAALQNGYMEYPVVVARGWSEEKKRAVRIKDNAFALMSGWDQELLRAEIGLLKVDGYELKLLGFGDAQLVNFMTTPGPPGQFPEFGENIPTQFCCPKCAYRWSGNPNPGAEENGGTDEDLGRTSKRTGKRK
jgi:hypothetical protein